MQIWIFALVGLIILEALADYFAGGFATNGKIIWAITSLLCYIFANISWLVSIRNGSGLAKGAAIFAISSVLLGAAIGILVYNEHLSVLQYIGIGVGVVALALILY
ncbi:MAG: hypothetical protein ACR2IQ_02410 [Minisyncoccia bacterium]